METITHAAIHSNYMLFPAIIRIDPNLMKAKQIIEIVCKHEGLTVERIKQKTRKRHIVKARQIATYLIKKHCTYLSLMQIAILMEQSDHTTILNSIKVVRNEMHTDPQYKYLVTKIESKI